MSGVRRSRPSRTRLSKAVPDLSVLAEADENADESQLPSHKENTVKQVSNTSKLTEVTNKNTKKKVKVKEENPEEIEPVQDLNQLLLRCLENVKGQKTLIKKLFTERMEMVNVCDKNLMRRALWEPHFMIVPEGYKLVGYFFHEIGFVAVENLIAKILRKPQCPRGHCSGIGESLMMAWKLADKNEMDEEKEAIENIWSGIVRESILCEGNVGGRYLEITKVLENLDRTKFDPFLSRILNSVLNTYIRAVNGKVRLEAARFVFRFYPLLPDDETEREDLILELMNDEVVDIRCMATIEAFTLMSTFWSVISMDFVRQIMERTVDVLTDDSVPSVRSAVYKGLRQLFDCAGGVNIFEHALKIVVPKGIDDKHEKVRLSCLILLNSIKNHRFIRYFDVVEVEALLARFEIETSQPVLEELVKLVYNSYHPKNSAPSKKIVRLSHMIKKGGRNTALNFHRLIFKLGLITVIDAVQLIKFMLLNIYNRWKYGNADANLSNCTLNDTVSTTVDGLDGPVAPEVDPTSEEFCRELIMFECVIALWRSLSHELSTQQYAPQNQLLEGLGEKFFKKMYAFYKHSPLVGATMTLGGLLQGPNMDVIAGSVLKSLVDGSTPEESLVPSLDFVASWRIPELIDLIRKGFEEIKNVFPCTTDSSSHPNRSPPRKRAKAINNKTPAEQVKMSISYLRSLLCTQRIHISLCTENVFYLQQCFESLGSLNDVILSFLSLSSDIDPPIDAESIMQMIRLKNALSNMLITAAQLEAKDAFPVDHFLLDYQQSFEWLNGHLIPRLNELLNADDPRWMSGFEMCKMQFDSTSILLNLVDVIENGSPTAAVKAQKRRDRGNSTDVINLSGVPLSHTLLSTIVDVLTSLNNKDAPSTQLCLVLDTSRALSNYISRHPNHPHKLDITAIVAQVAATVPDWVKSLQDQIDDSLSRSCQTMYKGIFDGKVLEDAQKERAMRYLVRTLLIGRIDAVKEVHDVEDPRTDQYEICSMVGLLVHKCVWKSKNMQRLFFTHMHKLFSENTFLPQQENLDELLYRIGAAAQLAYLSELNILKKKQNKSESTIQRSSDEVRQLLSILRERLFELLQREGVEVFLNGVKCVPYFDDDSLKAQVKELIEYEERTAF